MNLRDLEYLVALADHRHFGRAAAACFVSQPTLSTQLKKLEGELGAELIERGSRGVLLTATGDQVVARARAMLGEADDIRSIATQARDPRSGTLRLGVFPTLAPYLLPHVMPALRSRFPQLELLLVEEKTGELLDQLHSGRVDAAVLALPVTSESLESVPLFREEFLLAVPRTHPLAQQDAPLTLAQLGSTDLLLLAEGHCLRDQALAVCHTAGLRERDGFRATSLETLRHMVASGVGVTLMPELSVSPPVPAYDDITLRRLGPSAPYRDVGLLWRRGSVYRDLMSDLAESLRSVPGGLVTPAGEPTQGLPHNVAESRNRR
ncbi:LysR substrate-binding domain-containing protein [Gephyromycinifex aptenodytis]|uniref:LysR substrate-binding domain-containing protein n=1 Tax=Gephyromycinifex aptenodytis TaxID=2716227 RepID=UPI001447A8E7|nr:LysR substrate-binding domain-containing protein [Gephyromycinifex aptenodytis]